MKRCDGLANGTGNHLFGGYPHRPGSGNFAQGQKPAPGRLLRHSGRQKRPVSEMSSLYPENGKTLVIHIGMPKAGSTSIQAMLHSHRAALALEGVTVLPLGRNHSTVLSQICQQDDLDPPRAHVFDLADAGLLGADLAGLRAHVAQAAAGAAPLSLCSGERLFSFDRAAVQALQDLLAPHFQQIRILAYLREPVAWANSRVQQAVKSKRALRRRDARDSLQERGLAENLVPNYRNLESYLAVFGPDRIDCRPFARSAFVQADLLADFWHAVGRPDLIGRFDAPEQNASISQEAVILIDLVKALTRRYPRLSPLADRLRHRLRAVPGEPFRLPVVEQARVRAQAQAQLQWLHQEFGIDLTLHQGPIQAPRPRWRPATLRAVDAALRELLPGAFRPRRLPQARPIVTTKGPRP